MAKKKKYDVLMWVINKGTRARPRYGPAWQPKTARAWSWFKKHVRLTRIDIQSGLVVKRVPSTSASLERRISDSGLKVGYGGRVD